jgi:hypothetical protein
VLMPRLVLCSFACWNMHLYLSLCFCLYACLSVAGAWGKAVTGGCAGAWAGTAGPLPHGMLHVG